MAISIYTSFGLGSNKIGVTHIPATQKDRWTVAKEWCDGKVGQQAHATCPLNVHKDYFQYDGHGYFAPQKKTWIDALCDLGRL